MEEDLNEGKRPPSVMVRISGKPFYCECGANVFHKPDPHNEPNIYRCNGCDTEYKEE